MAYILHIDTSGDTGLVALARAGEVLSVIENTDTRNHTATINYNIESVLSQNNISLKDIDAFCVCGGPGSYTGLRIGLATAKGFCYALDKPLMMHNRLLLLAINHIYSNADADILVTVLHAREQEYFIAAFNRQLNPVAGPQHIMADDLAAFSKQLDGKILCIGYTDDVIKNNFTRPGILFEQNTKIDVKEWAKYAFGQYNCNEFVSLANCEPFYLKQVYTHKSKKIS